MIANIWSSKKTFFFVLVGISILLSLKEIRCRNPGTHSFMCEIRKLCVQVAKIFFEETEVLASHVLPQRISMYWAQLSVLLIARMIRDKVWSQVNVYSPKQFLWILNDLAQRAFLTSILDMTTMFGGSENATIRMIFLWWMALVSRMLIGIISSNNIGVALQLPLGRHKTDSNITSQNFVLVQLKSLICSL